MHVRSRRRLNLIRESWQSVCGNTAPGYGSPDPARPLLRAVTDLRWSDPLLPRIRLQLPMAHYLRLTLFFQQFASHFARSVLVWQRNGRSEHAVRIETPLQGSQPGTVAAVSILGLFAIMWRQLIRVAAG